MKGKSAIFHRCGLRLLRECRQSVGQSKTGEVHGNRGGVIGSNECVVDGRGTPKILLRREEGGGLERGRGKGGGERLGSCIDILLGDHGTYTPGILSTLLDPVPPVGGGLVNPETNRRGRRGWQIGGEKQRGGRGEGVLLASKRRGRLEQTD